MELFEKDDSDKSSQIQQWLNNSASSCNIIVEDQYPCSPTINYSDLSALILFNKIGEDLYIIDLSGLQFAQSKLLIDVLLKQNECILLSISNEHQPTGLGFSEQQNIETSQELTIKIGNIIKTVNLTRAHKQIYDLSSSSIQIVCNTEIQNNHRFIILSLIIKVCNNTAIPLVASITNSNDKKQPNRISKSDAHDEDDLPVELTYVHSSPMIFTAIDE